MWEINITDQILTFLYSAVFGAILCLYYDLFRASRKVLQAGFVSVLLGDLFFWITAAFSTFLFLLSRTNGEIRGYVIAAMLSGFAVFRVTLSRFFMMAAVFILRIAVKIIALFCAATEKFCLCFDNLSVKTEKIIKSSLKSLKKLLKNVWYMLYTNSNTLNHTEMESIEDETKAQI